MNSWLTMFFLLLTFPHGGNAPEPSSKRQIEYKPGAPNLIVSINKKLLIVRNGDITTHVYHVAVGTKVHPTPTGRFRINHIVWNPDWVPPAKPWAKGKKPTPAGHPDNPMKVVKIFFQEPDYYIHGTDKEESLGGRASHGCVRMSEREVGTLARHLMDVGGAAQSDEWFDEVLSGEKKADIRLPQTIPLIVAP